MLTDTYARTDGLTMLEDEPVTDRTYARTAMEDINEFTQKLVSWGRKRATADNYAMVLGMLTEILRRKGLETDPRTITEDDIYSLFRGIERAPSTKKRYLSTLQQYCAYYDNPIRINLLVNQEAPCTKWITDSDVQRCLDACRSDTERMMIHLGADYGLRRAEIANLSIGDIDWNSMLMTVHGKGHGDLGKIRQVPMMENDVLLQSFVSRRMTEGAHTHAPLLYHNNNSRTGSIRYRPEYIGKIVREIMDRAGVDGTCHSLRRNFITSAYKANGDEGLVHIMRIVGHESIQETIGYISRDPTAMREIMKIRSFYISRSG